jgi:putative membrane protein
MHVRNLLWTGVLSLAMCTAGVAQSAANDTKSGNNSKANNGDQAFMMKAAQGNQAEVQLGKMAAEKASDQQVKDFANRMVQDHQKANDQLKQVAQQDKVPVPTEPNAAEKAAANRLSKLSGTSFDKAYMRHMVQDHTKDVAEFQKESQSAKDQNVKQFASQTLPTLQDHLKQAKQISAQVNGGKNASKSRSSYR